MENLLIKNQKLSAEISALGAQLMSIKSREGKEYLWQGDEKYWKDRAPVLFPVIGRMKDEQYLYKSKVYKMGIHGFAAGSKFDVTDKRDDFLRLELDSSEESLRQYPFEFNFGIDFRLTENKLKITYRVKNLSDELMPFGVGGHPGIKLPLNENEHFEDYFIEFSQSSAPYRVGFSEDLLINCMDSPFPLEKGRILRLKHDLFDDDAIVLRDMPRSLKLKSVNTGSQIEMEFPQMPYLGLWHTPNTDAGFVCIEPWSSLPGRHGINEEISCRSDYIYLPKGETYENSWSIKIN